MTKREMYEALLGIEAVQENQELVLGIQHEIELLNRKNTGSKKASKITEEIKNQVYEALSLYDTPVTIKQLIEENDDLSGYTSQKLVPVLKALETEGKTVRTVEKRIAKFAIVNA